MMPASGRGFWKHFVRISGTRLPRAMMMRALTRPANPNRYYTRLEGFGTGGAP
jgi:hypothetical protein